MSVQAPVSENDPRKVAWEAWKAMAEFENARRWALHEEHVDGSLWWAFIVGYAAATDRAAALHESINPASDDERQAETPGAGAMGAVIEYRDAIRLVEPEERMR